VASESEFPPIRQSRAKLADLADALDMVSSEMKAYLDLETGEVLYVSDDAWRELETVQESMPEEVWQASDEEQEAAFKAALEEYDPLSVEEEELENAHAVEQGLGARFVELPEADTQASYRDMEAFVDTVTSPRLRQRLDTAIRGRGAFRRFKDELYDEPSEQERWYAFKSDRLRERIREWLVDERIELVEGSD